MKKGNNVLNNYHISFSITAQKHFFIISAENDRCTFLLKLTDYTFVICSFRVSEKLAAAKTYTNLHNEVRINFCICL